MDLEYCASLAILTRKAWHWVGWDMTCPLLLLRVFGETGGGWGQCLLGFVSRLGWGLGFTACSFSVFGSNKTTVS